MHITIGANVLSEKSFLVEVVPGRIEKQEITFELGLSMETLLKDPPQLIQDYRGLLEKFKELSERKIETLLKVLFYESPDSKANCFILFLSDLSSVFSKEIAVYYPENSESLKVTKEIFHIGNESVALKALSLNEKNFFCPVGNLKILELIYCSTNLRANGIEPFRVFKMKSKKNGKIREIVAPHEDIKRILRELDAILQMTYGARNKKFQVAYKKGMSILSGVKLHKENRFIVKLDIHDFFPSCKRELMEKYLKFLFQRSFNQKYLEEEFYKIILRNNSLFLGSPISGSIANVILSPAMTYLEKMAKNMSLTLSVYADDIAISSKKRLSKEFIEKLFIRALTPYNLENFFKLNGKKTKAESKNRRHITGVSINNNNEMTVSRYYFREIRSYLSSLSKTGNMTVSEDKLRGKIAYALMVDETGKVKRYLKKFEKTVTAYNLCKAEKFV